MVRRHPQCRPFAEVVFPAVAFFVLRARVGRVFVGARLAGFDFEGFVPDDFGFVDLLTMPLSNRVVRFCAAEKCGN